MSWSRLWPLGPGNAWNFHRKTIEAVLLTRNAHQFCFGNANYVSACCLAEAS